MKSIQLSRYFEIVRPQYVFLRLIPLKSIRNYNSDKIISAVATTYKTILQRIRRREKKYFFHVCSKVAYYIYMEQGRVEFYFILPAEHETLLRDKIADTWHGITIQQVDALPLLPPESLKYYLAYKQEDALSLSTDRRSNVLLSSLLNKIDVMEQGDSVAILYNFVSCDQTAFKAAYDDTMRKLQEGYPIEREKVNAIYLLKLFAAIIVKVSEFILAAVNHVMGEEHKDLPALQKRDLPLQPDTIKKRESRVVKTQIVVMSHSLDANRATNNMLSVCEAFESIKGDNELIYRRMTAEVDINKTMLTGAESITTTGLECQNFLALPGKELIESHNCIEHIDTLESEVPKELQAGYIRVGVNTYRGKQTAAYLTSDTEYKHLALVLIGPTRSGKTTYISNVAMDTVSAGECTILFDFCGNCELSKEVAPHFPNALIIDCADGHNLQGLGYNEVNPNEPDTFLRYRNAKMMAMQLLTLIDAIVYDAASLTSKMDRYLECAALVVFMSGGSIQDVFSTLQHHKTRHEFIRRVPETQRGNLSEYIEGLQELDEIDKQGTVSGTKNHLISGIMDRINKLKQNTYMELMLKKDCSNNINLVNEIQKAQLICLKMPESMFATEREKDIYCTYWITKIWLALQIRKMQDVARVPVNIIVDELYQVPSCQDFIRSKLSQMAKFSAKMIISCHYLGQIKIIRDELKAANSSYLLISGCDKDNFNEIKEELAPYTVDDLLLLKRYHALCLLKCSDGYARFTVKLPPPIR